MNRSMKAQRNGKEIECSQILSARKGYRFPIKIDRTIRLIGDRGGNVSASDGKSLWIDWRRTTS